MSVCAKEVAKAASNNPASQGNCHNCLSLAPRNGTQVPKVNFKDMFSYEILINSDSDKKKSLFAELDGFCNAFLLGVYDLTLFRYLSH